MKPKMRVIQIIPRQNSRLYALMIQKEIELAKRNKGTFHRSGPKQKDVAKWSHATYDGWVWLERGLGEVVLAELGTRSSNGDEWQLLHAFLGFLDRHFADKIAAINIQYIPEK
jgi:hypothetical protein